MVYPISPHLFKTKLRLSNSLKKVNQFRKIVRLLYKESEITVKISGFLQDFNFNSNIIGIMISKKIAILSGLFRRIGMTHTDRQILRNLLDRGRSFPGDVLKDLRISQNPGLKSIRELTHKGYIIREDKSSFIRINPDMRVAVKIMTG